MTARVEPGRSRGMRARQLLRIRTLWISALAITGVLIFLVTLVYIGSVVDPLDHLSGLPVLVVNDDAGATAGPTHVNLGDKVVSALRDTPAVADRLTLESSSLADARSRMDTDGAYATIVLPRTFSSSTLELYGVGSSSTSAPGLPAVELLTNVRAGSLGVSLASGVASPALLAISHALGHTLSGTFPAPAGASASTLALRANPITITTVPYRPLPPHSALGLSAFYISLLAIMCGFLGGTLINATVDGALGYATTEIGPKWTQRMPVAISRWQTLAAKWVMALVIPPILVLLLLAVAVGILHMDAAYFGLLWLFLSFGAVVIALGTLVLFAAFGNLGQLVAMLVFIYLALASSGGTIPVQALPGVLKFTANFEPLRQVLDGTRAILYFNASGAAGLTRGFVLTGLGLVLWLVLGVAVTTWYDRRGLVRMEPDVLEYVNRSAAAYVARSETDASSGSHDAPPDESSGTP